MIKLLKFRGIASTGGEAKILVDEGEVRVNGQGAYFHLDSEPKTLAAKAHRPAYGTDGDYFSKPSIEDIFDAVYTIMNEADPTNYPSLY